MVNIFIYGGLLAATLYAMIWFILVYKPKPGKILKNDNTRAKKE